MIAWDDEAIVLAAQPHGEDAAVVHVLTREHGKHAGLARGAQGKRNRATYQPGTLVHATWRARLPEHLGTLTCEPVETPLAGLMDAPRRLTALAAAMAVADAALPEREAYPRVFAGTRALVRELAGEAWAEAYVHWERELLGVLGFGLDLSRCAGGGDGPLIHVSPRTGRAVSETAGAPYADRLLPLPGFLVGRPDPDPAAAVAGGLHLTGYFLHRHVFDPAGLAVPPVRERLAASLRRAAGDA